MTLEPHNGLLPGSRRVYLLQALTQQGSVRVADVADALGVSSITIRRDLAQLADEGLVHRVHGGAQLIRDASIPIQPAVPVVATRTPTSTSVGMIVPSLDYYWPEIVRGAEEEARSRGLHTVLRGSSYGNDDDQTQIEHLLDQARVGGLLLAPNMDSPRAAEMLDWLVTTGVPSVLVERQATVPPHDQPMESVVSDHASGAMAAVRHLVDLGHTRVGLVLSEQSPTGPHVRRGWIQASAECGLDVSGVVDRMVARRQSLDADPVIGDIIDECLSSGTTALLVHADPEAIAIVQQCQNQGLHVPGDLSIVAYDDEVAGLFSPAITAVRPPRSSIGRAAMWLLASRMDDAHLPTHRIVVTPKLQVRDSTGPATRVQD
ncbi:substrate-binding domain-containing protein [Brooklawnia cerclae]|uniref:DNA-binding LacI/PurR family transcriptional regulator n=1 Tax=Brooklawnia cerclae TaxID=349934 RepID=A0ABX0SL11_9ACTN|nr:LacI family DNA-binding transcriptional regulator [Brooklawnia cerclae]NIH58634.1 DNA-binding LacI/PurR family transcriptional regulator [Brooklawnia cerclae]